MRGRLIHRFRIEVAQLDTRATEAVVGGGYDPIFNEPRVLTDGTSSRRETMVLLEAQVEPQMFNAYRGTATGQVREARFVCTVHQRELERAQLLDEVSGVSRLRVHDRLSAVYTLRGELVLRIPPIPGLYLREPLPTAFGFGGKVNLLQLEFVSRQQAR